MVRIPLHGVPDGSRLPSAGPETPSAGFLPDRLPPPLRPGPLLPGFSAHQRCQVLRADPRAVRGDCGFSRRGLLHGSHCPEGSEGIAHETSAVRKNVKREAISCTAELPPISCGDKGLFDYLKVLRMYSAISFASLSDIVFASKRVIPGPGFLIFPMMSWAVMTPWASLSFLWSVMAGLMIFPPSGWQAAQLCWNNFAPFDSIFSAA